MYNLRSYDDIKKGRTGNKIYSDSYDIYSVPVPGDGMVNYSTLIAEASLWLTSNFANTTEPNNPVTGQLWWDSTSKELKVFSGTWSVVKSNVFDSTSLNGDLLPQNLGFNLGSGTHRFNELHVNTAYVSSSYFQNSSGQPKNITITKDGSISISTNVNGYTDSSGVSPTLPQSISLIQNNLGTNINTSWAFIDLGTTGTVSAQSNKVYYVTYDPPNSNTPLRIVPSQYNIDFQVILFTNTFFGGINIDDASETSAISPVVESKPTISWPWSTVTDTIHVQESSPVITKINFIHENLVFPTVSVAKRYINITVLSTGIKGEWDVIITGVEV